MAAESGDHHFDTVDDAYAFFLSALQLATKFYTDAIAQCVCAGFLIVLTMFIRRRRRLHWTYGKF